MIIMNIIKLFKTNMDFNKQKKRANSDKRIVYYLADCEKNRIKKRDTTNSTFLYQFLYLIVLFFLDD